MEDMEKKMVVELMVKEFPPKKTGRTWENRKFAPLKVGLCRGVMVLLVLPRPLKPARWGLGTLGLKVQVPAQRGFWGQRGGLRGGEL